MLHRGSLVGTGSWRLSRSSQLAVLKKKSASHGFWEGEDMGCSVGPNDTMWAHITEDEKIQAQLERDRGREHNDDSCLGLPLGPEYPTSLWQGALSPCSRAGPAVSSLHFGCKGLQRVRAVSEKSLSLRALEDLTSWFTQIPHFWALLRSVNLGVSASICVSGLQMR